MSAHHLLNEDDMKKVCLYCGEDFDPEKWESLHYVRKHYKTNQCGKCGKDAKIEVGFEGSGHDSWSCPFTTKKKKVKEIITVVESPLERAIKNA